MVQWGGSGVARLGAWAGEDGAGGGAADGGQSGMKIHTDDHLAVILLQATGVTGEALLAEISAAMSPVTSAGRRMREMTVNMVPLRARRAFECAGTCR
ncbi:hypothetical protein A5760_07245 [Mycobacterium colombiense]|uniref:Uncharacterized protein n=1 Tax=Mycobacterium colombiense TaxID=339268 RepID=A0A1A0VRC9_9MYCO|nr:hypothetical protein A5760_07245 [Mycobacterium colombiense]